MLKVVCIVNGYLEENCYIIHNDKDALIIDPGSEGKHIIEIIEKLKVNIKGILITHSHFDHVGALDEINNKYKVEVIDNKNRKENINGFKYKIIENYGHTMDSVSYYFYEDKIMFTGDFVFRGSIGKYDYENEEIMYSSLKEFKKLDKDIIIYPGHGEPSTIDLELKYNPFLRGI